MGIDEPVSGARSGRAISATYPTSFPYLLVFVIGMFAATWFVTTLVFR